MFLFTESLSVARTLASGYEGGGTSPGFFFLFSFFFFFVNLRFTEGRLQSPWHVPEKYEHTDKDTDISACLHSICHMQWAGACTGTGLRECINRCHHKRETMCKP